MERNQHSDTRENYDDKYHRTVKKTTKKAKYSYRKKQRRRKRRSSILKSQRPPRTPFSEVELNVATPTDPGKSRRVSFSKRTGVAEFVTNEATTTWKNFYEEHNKSLESSGNESAANAPRQVIGHIGKSLFDQQFEEIEVVDIGGTLQPNTGQEFQTPHNNLDLTQQFAAFECIENTADIKLSVPVQNFELSSLTDHNSKVFGNELSLPAMSEMSNPIDINFSNITQIGSSNKCDDLEEIERDLERSDTESHLPNVLCPGPFGGKDLSEYIEVDLNMTTLCPRNDDCDMSITDFTIQSPKIQEALTSNINKSLSIHKKSNVDDDWLVDKENIVCNPYVAPRESLNLAVNDLCDEVLVFDGKKLVVQSESKSFPKVPMVLQTVTDDIDLSITQTVDNKIDIPKRKTIVFEDDLNDISITQALPTNVIIDKDEMKKTILYENDVNLSITQAIPTNIIPAENAKIPNRKSIVYDDANISFTQAIPSNVILNDNKKSSEEKTVYFQDDLDISITQVIPENIIKSSVTNIINDSDNISMTQAIPTNIITNKKLDNRNSVHSIQHMDTTEGVADSDILINKNNPEKRRTILYEQDAGNVSVTEVIPSNILLDRIKNSHDNLREQNESLKSIAKDIKNKTIHGDQVDVSITKVLPSNILECKDVNITSCVNDLSITRSLPTNILSQPAEVENENQDSLLKESNSTNDKTMNNKDITSNAISKISEMYEPNVLNNGLGNLSMTKPIPTEILEMQNELSNKCDIDIDKSILTGSSTINHDILIYQSLEQKKSEEKLNETNENQSIVEDKCRSNISIKKSMTFGIKEDSLNLSQDVPKEKSFEICNENKIEADISVNDIEKEIKENDNIEEKALMPVQKPSIVQSSTKKSILNELLDMSSSLINVEETPALEYIENNQENNIDINIQKTVKEEKSNNSLFVITQDSVDEMKIESVKVPNCTDDNKTCKPIDSIEEIEQISNLQRKVAELKVLENRKSENRHYEKILSLDLQKSVDKLDNSIIKSDLSMPKGIKLIKNADDTKELLEILSDFTDEQSQKQDSNKSGMIDHTIQNKTLPTRMSINGKLNIEKKIESTRLSLIPKSQSIALSREDLLNNISIVQAGFRQSRMEFEENESMETSQDSLIDTNISEIKKLPKKVRMSTEVVKTLQFEEDDSVSDSSINNDMKISPLKKTAFGESSYMKEDKTKVIPSYLKDVSDGIKALMHDLVKPTADGIPFATETERPANKSTSTCSTQIQANLVTSSQIDFDADLRSIGDSNETVKPNLSMDKDMHAKTNGPLQSALKKSCKPITKLSSEINDKSNTEAKEYTFRQSPGPVIVFDHHNPLNNILINQTDCSKVHKYEPIIAKKERENNITEEINNETELEVERMSTHYNIESTVSSFQTGMQSGDMCVEKVSESISMSSNASKPISIDRSTEGIAADVKDIEVNTLIAMKGNKDILESYSSLTLVDDALKQPNFDVDIESHFSLEDERQKSPTREFDEMEIEEAVIDKDNKNSANNRKRNYSPTKHDRQKKTIPIVDVTPKPANKMQKISNSPESLKATCNQNEQKTSPKRKSKCSPEKKKSPKKGNSNRENLLTVQQFVTECCKNAVVTKLNKDILDVTKNSSIETLDTQTLSQAMEGVKSIDIACTLNSKHTKEMQDVCSSGSKDITAVGSEVSHVDWDTEAIGELSSMNLNEECSPSSNVVAIIDTLQFMGRECEWESSSGDTWMFRLLRSRLRLSVRLAHTHHNASRSRVRAKTALVSVNVDTVQEDKDPLASLCVRLAMESMRYECSRCTTAGDVPALLRRCVGVARVARRWAGVMRDARARLAYTVTPEGDLTLKVANIPLRSVWEVRMRVELVVGDEREGAWPRAEHLHVASVLAGGSAPSPPRLQRLVERLPEDWGHAPAVLWKVFKYLKNKTREDDVLL